MAPATPPPPPGGARGPLIHVATRCESLDDFVVKFANLASEGALVLPASGELPIGTEGRFAIRLKDQSVAMRGRCRVTDARPGPPSATGSSGRHTLLRVALLDMEEASLNVHRRLLARRRAMASVPMPVAPEPSDPTLVSEKGPEAPGSPTPATQAPPPVSPLAATMIGLAPQRARAGTSPLGVPRPSALAEPRGQGAPFALPPNPLVTPPPVEMRVPGASFTLPANPLSDMDAQQLSSFIDSTLFESDEDDATVEQAPARSAGPDDVTVQRPPPDEPVLPEAPPERVERTAPKAPAAAAPVWRAADVTARVRKLVGNVAQSVKKMDRRELAVRTAPYLACVLVGILIGLGTRGSPRRAPVSPPAVVVAPNPPPAAPPPAVPEAAEETPPPAAAPAKPSRIDRARHTAAAAASARGAPVAADGACQANIVTEPAEAKITWRGKPLGTSPLAGAAIPCGAGALTISHERYETVTRTLTADASAPLAVSERLHRPPATLVINSSPAGASISLNGHPLGPAPRRVPTLRYEHITLRATLPGYASWSKKLYLTEATTQVNAQLGGRRR